MWNAVGAVSFVSSLPCDMRFFGVLHFWMRRPAAYVSFPAYTLTCSLFFTMSGRCSIKAVIFRGMDGSYHPSVGAHTLDRGVREEHISPLSVQVLYDWQKVCDLRYLPCAELTFIRQAVLKEGWFMICVKGDSCADVGLYEVLDDILPDASCSHHHQNRTVSAMGAEAPHPDLKPTQ